MSKCCNYRRKNDQSSPNGARRPPNYSEREIVEAMNVSKERICHILNQHLGLRKLSARWVPRLLNKNRKYPEFVDNCKEIKQIIGQCGIQHIFLRQKQKLSRKALWWSSQIERQTLNYLFTKLTGEAYRILLLRDNHRNPDIHTQLAGGAKPPVSSTLNNLVRHSGRRSTSDQAGLPPRVLE
ncbi:hypothetical protein TNCV_2230921 [Trichonephila clavipes]|uniref:Uncharacterized protein n=1 Tax=Trichonephila clavipes TaxID=2585209 RepID=A0A8X6WDQ3_TRICX|nr:hypothetical protein TNCV_2230921 [Trichonephila clavipes]